MDTLRIYLASSEELAQDKLILGNLARRLDGIYLKRGIRVELVDSDDIMDDDERHHDIKNSQMFVALFHKDAGRVTIEEFQEAYNDLKNNSLPKIYTYCKEVSTCDIESQDLMDFKKKLYDELGHYWCKYGNQDSLQLHLVMQIQLVENSSFAKIEVKDGSVMIGNEEVARLDNVPFVANNADFQEKKKKLLKLSEKLERKRLKVEKDPDDEDNRQEYDDTLNDYEDLKKEIAVDEDAIFKTALEITKLQQNVITDRMRRAMEEFSNGNVQKANIILEEARHDADMILEKIEKDEKILEKDKELGRKSIDELLLNISTTLADLSLNIYERIKKSECLYEKVCALAKKACGEFDDRYLQVITDFYDFLFLYAHYEKAFDVIKARQHIIEKTNKNDLLANLYYDYSLLYQSKFDNEKSLEFGKKALDSMPTSPNDSLEECFARAIILKVIGDAYINNPFASDIDKTYAVECYEDALPLFERCGVDCIFEYTFTYLNLGIANYTLNKKENAKLCFSDILEHKDFIENALKKLDNSCANLYKASFYEGLGMAYTYTGRYAESMYFLETAYNIFCDNLGENHPRVIQTCLYAGSSLLFSSNYDDALQYFLHGLQIISANDVYKCPVTYMIYDMISNAYNELGDYENAWSYANQGMLFVQKNQGELCDDMASVYKNFADICHNKREYDDELVYLEKALEIYNEDSDEYADTCSDIGFLMYCKFDNNDAAIEFYNKALSIKEQLYGGDSGEIVKVLEYISDCYYDRDDFDEALRLYNRVLKIKLNEDEFDNDEVAKSYNDIASVYRHMKLYDVAIEYYEKSITLLEKNGLMNRTLADAYYYAGRSSLKLGNSNTVSYYKKSLDVYYRIMEDGYSPSATVCEDIKEMEEYVSNN